MPRRASSCGEVSDASDDESLARGPTAAALVERLRVLAQKEVADGRAALPRLLPQAGLGLPLARDGPVLAQRAPPFPEPCHTGVEEPHDELGLPDTRAGELVYESPAGSAELQEGLPATVYLGTLDPWYSIRSPDDLTLQFESRFESGNLLSARRGSVQHSYELMLHPDRNTSRHTMWYYFRVANVRAGVTYRFSIVNLLKPSSVYELGMKPCIYSTKAAARGSGWARGGESVNYASNGMRRGRGRSYYTLSFSYTCPRNADGDVVYFAHCFPYTYTDLQKYLEGLEADPARAPHLRRRALCYSVAQNRCEAVTITNFTAPETTRRRGIVITARVHPGETSSSWMMQGVLDFLTGPSVDAAILRQNFVFQLVPMLNPDGVVVGNHRCCLLGQDLNRCWAGKPSPQLQPTIAHAKALLQDVQQERDLVLYLDLHGHSRKMNIFLYGSSGPSGRCVPEQVFPKLLCAQPPYDFASCCFKVPKAKEGTARVVAYRELGISNAYTVEASFCGADFGPFASTHFSQADLEAAGQHLCDGVLDLFDPDPSKVQAVLQELEARPHASTGVCEEEDEDEEKTKPSGRRASRAPREKSASTSRPRLPRPRASGRDLRSVLSAPVVAEELRRAGSRRRKSVQPAPTIMAPGSHR